MDLGQEGQYNKDFMTITETSFLITPFMSLPWFKHSHKKQKDNLETRAVSIEISMLS